MGGAETMFRVRNRKKRQGKHVFIKVGSLSKF